MKKKYLIFTLLALFALTLSAGIAKAAERNNDNFFGNRKNRPDTLTETEKTEMQAKRTAVEAALSAGDYNAWVSAQKALDENCPELKRVTAANFSDYAKEQKNRETKRTEMRTKMEAVKAALTAGNYDSWVAGEKAMNENSPALQKINATNFQRYAEAHKLRQQANTIMEELGLDNQDGKGFSPMDKGGHGPRQ
jgi:hypothetical protein